MKEIEKLASIVLIKSMLLDFPCTENFEKAVNLMETGGISVADLKLNYKQKERIAQSFDLTFNAKIPLFFKFFKLIYDEDFRNCFIRALKRLNIAGIKHDVQFIDNNQDVEMSVPLPEINFIEEIKFKVSFINALSEVYDALSAEEQVKREFILNIINDCIATEEFRLELYNYAGVAQNHLMNPYFFVVLNDLTNLIDAVQADVFKQEEISNLCLPQLKILTSYFQSASQIEDFMIHKQAGLVVYLLIEIFAPEFKGLSQDEQAEAVELLLLSIKRHTHLVLDALFREPNRNRMAIEAIFEFCSRTNSLKQALSFNQATEILKLDNVCDWVPFLKKLFEELSLLDLANKAEHFKLSVQGENFLNSLRESMLAPDMKEEILLNLFKQTINLYKNESNESVFFSIAKESASTKGARKILESKLDFTTKMKKLYDFFKDKAVDLSGEPLAKPKGRNQKIHDMDSALYYCLDYQLNEPEVVEIEMQEFNKVAAPK